MKPRLRDLPHEAFAVIFLNQKHGVLAYRELFRGSIHASSVHPREVVKAVLKENAAAVILAHNHPSGHARALLRLERGRARGAGRAWQGGRPT